MSPGKEDNDELVSNVRIGHIKVMLERRNIDVTVELDCQIGQTPYEINIRSAPCTPGLP